MSVFFSILLWQNYKQNHLLIFSRLSARLIILVPSGCTSMIFYTDVSLHWNRWCLTAATCHILYHVSVSLPPDINHTGIWKKDACWYFVIMNWVFKLLLEPWFDPNWNKNQYCLLRCLFDRLDAMLRMERDHMITWRKTSRFTENTTRWTLTLPVVMLLLSGWESITEETCKKNIYYRCPRDKLTRTK